MRKYIPNTYYWFFFMVMLAITFLPLEVYKNNQIKYYEKQFTTNFQYIFTQKIQNYQDVADFIYLNNIKVFKSLVSIKREDAIGTKIALVDNKFSINQEQKVLTYYFLNNNSSEQEIVSISFDLEDFLFDLTKKSLFNIKQTNDKKFLKNLNINIKKDEYSYFKYKKNDYIGTILTIKGNEFFIYKNISNSHLNIINKSINSEYVIIFILYLILLFLIYNLNQKRVKAYLFEHKFNEIIDALDKYVIMIKIDKKNKINYVTQSFCDWSYYTKDELLNKKFTRLIHPDVSEKFLERVKLHLTNNPKWEGEFKNVDKYGNSLWSKGVIFPVYDERSDLAGYTFILSDISDNRQMKKINGLLREELSNKLNEIKIKDDDYKDRTKVQLMSRILDSISHQWKEPIGNISIELTKFSIDLLDKELKDDSLVNIHKNIDNELKNLSISLNTFKSLFVKDSLNDKYNVYSVLKDAISLCSNEIASNGIKINLDIQKDIYCFGVSLEIRQIILSLLKYTIQQVKLRNIDDSKIEFTVIQDHDDVIVRYKDNTQNFSNSILEEVFDETKDDRIAKDLNINLHIAKLLVKKTGSKIWFENKDNQTLFYLKLISKDRRELKR